MHRETAPQTSQVGGLAAEGHVRESLPHARAILKEYPYFKHTSPSEVSGGAANVAAHLNSEDEADEARMLGLSPPAKRAKKSEKAPKKDETEIMREEIGKAEADLIRIYAEMAKYPESAKNVGYEYGRLQRTVDKLRKSAKGTNMYDSVARNSPVRERSGEPRVPPACHTNMAEKILIYVFEELYLTSGVSHEDPCQTVGEKFAARVHGPDGAATLDGVLDVVLGNKEKPVYHVVLNSKAGEEFISKNAALQSQASRTTRGTTSRVRKLILLASCPCLRRRM